MEQENRRCYGKRAYEATLSSDRLLLETLQGREGYHSAIICCPSKIRSFAFITVLLEKSCCHDEFSRGGSEPLLWRDFSCLIHGQHLVWLISPPLRPSLCVPVSASLALRSALGIKVTTVIFIITCRDKETSWKLKTGLQEAGSEVLAVLRRKGNQKTAAQWKLFKEVSRGQSTTGAEPVQQTTSGAPLRAFPRSSHS